MARSGAEELSSEAEDLLAFAAAVGPLPVAALGDDHTAAELRNLAERGVGGVAVEQGLLVVDLSSQPGLAGRRPAERAVRLLVDRLDRGRHDRLARRAMALLPPPCADLQSRLARDGGRLLAEGSFDEVRGLVAAVPPDDRTPLTVVLDAAAAAGLDQIDARSRRAPTVDDLLLASLAESLNLDPDSALLLAGLRVDLCRQHGDPQLVEHGLVALAGLGDLPDGTDPAVLLPGRSLLGLRGLALVYFGLGAAMSFLSTPESVAESRRLRELSFSLFERSGADAAPYRGLASFELASLGLARWSEAVVPLESGVAAWKRAGRPEAANLLLALAETYRRLGRYDEALTTFRATVDWGTSHGHTLVLASAPLGEAISEVQRDGPSRRLDAALDAAWELYPEGHLRRVAPTYAAYVAMAMMDVDDLPRAQLWLDRAEAMLLARLGSDSQQLLLEGGRRRLERLTTGRPVEVDEIAALYGRAKAAYVEARATDAWDLLRSGDRSRVDAVLAEFGPVLDPPWPERLGAPRPLGPTPVRVSMLCPQLRLEVDGEAVPVPRGHQGRLLAVLVARGGAATTDEVADALWPDEVDVAPNRVHQVVHRLRRTLDPGAPRTVVVAHGVVLLDQTLVGSDVAELRSSCSGHAAAVRSVLDAYESDLCAAQFAYDDLFVDARRDLRAQAVEVAASLLSGEGAADPSSIESVRGLWRRTDDDRLRSVLEDALVRAGRAEEAALFADR